MNIKALLLTILAVFLFFILFKVVIGLVFRLVPILLMLGLGYIVYKVIKNHI